MQSRSAAAACRTSCDTIRTATSSRQWRRRVSQPCQEHLQQLLPPSSWRRVSRLVVPAAAGTAGDVAGCVLGIDLGTTNSAAALVEGGQPLVVPNQEGATTTPSVVAFAADGNVLVGAAAKRQAGVNPRNTFYSVKRLIGQEFDDVEQDVQQLPYTVAADDDEFAVLECPNLAAASEAGTDDSKSPGRLYPEEVSAYVLAKLVSAAEEFTGRPVSKAVISVPAYFTDAQREATATAGRIAGLETVRIIREPVAAALAYGLDAREDQTVLVFDLGGGTFDVSLLEVGGGVIEVLSTGGDAHLGGDDWDAAIMQWLIDTHLKPARVDVKDPRLVANLRAVCEAAKIRLSSEDKVAIRMPVGGGIEAVLTRQMFESLTKDLFRRARLPLDQACWQAGVDLGTVVKEYEDAVRTIKKGGKSRSSKRQGGGGSKAAAAELASAGVQIRPKRRMPVSKAVALGAAVQAGIYEGQVSDLMVMDVWQASLMRAFATQLQMEQERADEGEGAGSGSSDEDDLEGWEEAEEDAEADAEAGEGSGEQRQQQQGEDAAAAAAAAAAGAQGGS